MAAKSTRGRVNTVRIEIRPGYTIIARSDEVRAIGADAIMAAKGLDKEQRAAVYERMVGKPVVPNSDKDLLIEEALRLDSKYGSLAYAMHATGVSDHDVKRYRKKHRINRSHGTVGINKLNKKLAKDGIQPAELGITQHCSGNDPDGMRVMSSRSLRWVGSGPPKAAASAHNTRFILQTPMSWGAIPRDSIVEIRKTSLEIMLSEIYWGHVLQVDTLMEIVL